AVNGCCPGRPCPASRIPIHPGGSRGEPMAAEMGLADLKARVERLDKLARGFSVGVGRGKGATDPLLYRERKAYLRAVQNALAGVEEARVTLARVVRRIEG